jgi:hypothetical protein
MQQRGQQTRANYRRSDAVNDTEQGNHYLPKELTMGTIALFTAIDGYLG